MYSEGSVRSVKITAIHKESCTIANLLALLEGKTYRTTELILIGS